MSELPNGWVIASIGEVTTDVQQRVPQLEEDFTYIDISSIDRETKRILNPQRLNGENAPSRARKVVRTNDVLVSMTRPNLNAVAIVPPELDEQIASTGFDVLRATGIDPHLLYFLVRSSEFVSAMSDLVQGALYPAVRSKDVRGFEIPLPPLNEQKRIATKLDALLERVDACRARLERVPLLLKRFRQAVLAAATSGQLTEDWREEHSETPAWQNANAEDLCEWITKGTTPSKDRMFEGAGEVPYIKVYNLCFDGNLDFTVNPTFIDTETHNVALKRSKVFPGDVLMNIVGPPLGKVSIVPDAYPEWNINQAIAVFRPKDKLHNQFLAYVLMSDKTLSSVVRKSKATAGQFNLTLEICREIEVPVPSMNEQREIVRRVETLFAYADRLEARYQQARAAVERLTPALLAKAFRGELVPQDPNDEPAAALLARIQAERAATTASPRSRSRSAAPATPAQPVAASANGSTAHAVRLPFAAAREPAAPTSQTKDDAAGDADDSDDATSDTATTNTARAATNGHRSAPPDIEEFDRETLLATLREVFPPGTRYDADTAIRTVAHTLGYARTGARIHERLKNTLRVAVQRGILVNESGEYRLDGRTIHDYTQDECVAALLAAIPRAWIERDEAIKAATRYLGFRKTGSALREAFKSAINGAIRRGYLEYDRETIRKRS